MAISKTASSALALIPATFAAHSAYKAIDDWQNAKKVEEQTPKEQIKRSPWKYSPTGRRTKSVMNTGLAALATLTAAKMLRR